MHHFVASNPAPTNLLRHVPFSAALQHESTTLHFNQQRMNPVLMALNCFSPTLSGLVLAGGMKTIPNPIKGAAPHPACPG